MCNSVRFLCPKLFLNVFQLIRTSCDRNNCSPNFRSPITPLLGHPNFWVPQIWGPSYHGQFLVDILHIDVVLVVFEDEKAI